MSKSEIPDSADVEEIETRIFDPTTPDDSIEEFYRFGQLLLSELQQRWSEIDRKLAILLGWSIGAIGILLLGHQRDHIHDWRSFWLVAAVLPALCSALLSAIALKTRIWRVPSRNDWFRLEIWNDPLRLRRYHLISIFKMQHENSEKLRKKAESLAYVEILMPLSALAIFSVFLFS